MTRPAALALDTAGMDQPKMVWVTLGFEPGSDPPRGRVVIGQTSYPFAGWLGLAAALEHVTSANSGTWASSGRSNRTTP